MVMLRVARGLGGVALIGSGALLYAGSWQRWSGECARFNGPLTRACDLRSDHAYDFLAPGDPWKPVGYAAELGGASLLVLAVALVVLPWALIGRRPGLFSALASLVVVLATLAVGVATLRSGLAGEVVAPVGGDTAVLLWLWVPPVLVIRLAVAARGWCRAAAIVLVLALPMVAAFSYALGSFDAAPWWEAVSGVFFAVAGACLVVAAARRTQPVEPAAESATVGAVSLPG